MPYRDNPQRPKVETFIVPYDETRPMRFAYVIFGVIAIVGAVGNYERVEIACTRSAPAATPHCVARSGIVGRTQEFDYTSPQSLGVAERTGRKNRRFLVITTPTGELAGAKSDSPSIVNEGAEYLQNPDRISWDVKYVERVVSFVAAIIGLGMMAVFYVVTRPKRVILDHRARTIGVNNGRPRRLDDMVAVTVGPLPKTETRSVLILTDRAGDDQKLVAGSDEAIRPVEAAIRAFISPEIDRA